MLHRSNQAKAGDSGLGKDLHKLLCYEKRKVFSVHRLPEVKATFPGEKRAKAELMCAM